MVISINEEKHLTKHPLMVKTLKKMEIEGELPQFDKEYQQKANDNIILSIKRLNAFLLRSGTRQDVCSHHSNLTLC